MNAGMLGISAGLLNQFTMEGQQAQLQIQQGKQQLETGKQQQQLNTLLLQQKQFELKNEEAKRQAIVQGYQAAQQAVNNPIDSSGNVSQGNNTDPIGLSPEITNAVKTQYSIGNALQKIGDPSYIDYFKKAEDLKKAGLAEAEAREKLNKQHLAEAAQKLNGLKDQDSLNTAILDMVRKGEDPRQLGLTGNWERDKPIIDRIRAKVLTVHEQNMEDEKKKSDERQDARLGLAEQREARMEKNESSRIAMERERLNLARSKAMTEDKVKAAKTKLYQSRADKALALYDKDYQALRKEYRDPMKVSERPDIAEQINRLNEDWIQRRTDLEESARADGVDVSFRHKPSLEVPKTTSKPQSTFTPQQESWIDRALQANPGMTREEVIQEGKKRKKL